MESVQSAFHKVSHEVKHADFSSFFNRPSAPPPPPPPAEISSSFSSGVLIARPPRNWVTLGTCSKLCAVCFVAGILVGYTLKRRVRRWLSGILRRLKDD